MIIKIFWSAVIVWPTSADSIIANGRNGSEPIISATLCRTLSTQPPTKPEIPPTITPMIVEIITAIAPIVIDFLPPLRILFQMSLPRSSVPNR